MSEEKGAIASGRGSVQTCSICHHSAPWHSLVCPKVGGAYCLECNTLLPRHYPWCSIGKRYQFFFWATPRDMQKELESHFNEHMRNRIVTPLAPITQIETPSGPEKFVMPEEGRRLIKEMLSRLAKHAAAGNSSERPDRERR